VSRNVFIADLHLRPQAPQSMKALSRLLETLSRGDTLWILGDLFEFWAGRGQETLPDHAPTLEALRRTSDRGIRLAFLPGNRDFLLDAGTLSTFGIERIADRESVVTLEGRRIYLAHGDFLCPNDKAYLRTAAVLRNPATLALIRALPFSVTCRLALRYRTHSEAKRAKPTAPGLYDLSEEMLADIAGRLGVDDLVIGHVHKPVDRPVAGSRAVLHILDPWEEDGKAPYLELSDGVFRRGAV